VAGLRPLLEQLKGKPIPNIVWLCKGFEYGTGLLPHQVVREVLGDAVPGAALSGPSFAQEVARGLPCALTVASPRNHCASAWWRWRTVTISACIPATTWSAWKSAAPSRTSWRSPPAPPTASAWA
jgi:glycerol-3-phosphate dehydrogenase